MGVVSMMNSAYAAVYEKLIEHRAVRMYLMEHRTVRIYLIEHRAVRMYTPYIYMDVFTPLDKTGAIPRESLLVSETIRGRNRRGSGEPALHSLPLAPGKPLPAMRDPGNKGLIRSELVLS